MDFQPVFISMGAAAVYSLLWYSRQVVDPTKPTPEYDPWQLGATLVVGLVIGMVSIVTGLDVSQAGIETKLAAYGFAIAVVEQIGKAIYRNFESGFGG